MKHIKNSLVVFAGVLFVTGVITSFMPSLTKGEKSSDVPKSAFSVTPIGTAHDFVVSGPDPEGTNYAITSLTVVSNGSVAASAIIHGLWGDTSDCVSFAGGVQSTFGPEVRVPVGETVHLSFPQPFILSAKPGAASCLRLETTELGQPALHYTAVGYRF